VPPPPPHDRGAQKLQIGPVGLRLALRLVHPVPIIHHFEFLPELWAYLPIHKQNENQLGDIHRSSSVRRKIWARWARQRERERETVRERETFRLARISLLGYDSASGGLHFLGMASMYTKINELWIYTYIDLSQVHRYEEYNVCVCVCVCL